MNFMTATVYDQTLTLPELAGQTLPLPPMTTQVTVGLRPDIFKRGGTACMNLMIEIVEQLGGEASAFARQGSSIQILTISLKDGRALRPGQNLIASFAPNRALLCDTNGQRVR